MATFVQAKRATAPLDDKARARLIGGGMLSSVSSSGSEHSAADYSSSSSLSDLVHSFLEISDIPDAAGNDSDHDKSPSSVDSTAEYIDDILKLTSETDSDPHRNILFSDVVEATELFSRISDQKPLYRRKVMSFLRERGHNAGICKTRWESSAGGSLTAGCYEFIDVISAQAQAQRYVVDVDFAAQFEIARPTSQYSNLSRVLPRVYVGKSGEDLKKIVRVTCDAAKRSLKRRELSLPPWRKYRYMVNKWFGPYKRTVNSAPVMTEFHNSVKCRRVGFDDGVSGRLIVRTR